MRIGFAVIYAVVFSVIISGLAKLFNESYEYVAVHFLVGVVAALAAYQTKEDE